MLKKVCVSSIYVGMESEHEDRVSPKTKGIFFTMCTSPLLDIHGPKYISETFTEIE
jgi:hypothetical protein